MVIPHPANQEAVVITNKLSFMVGGPAGVGVKTAGIVFARLCSRAGLHIFGNVEYPSIIRGDHNSYQVMVSEKPVYGHIRSLDVLLALDDLSIENHKEEIRPGGAVIHDTDITKLDFSELKKSGVLPVGIPFQSIIKQVSGAPKLANTVGIGATMGLLRFDFEQVVKTLKNAFWHLGEEILNQNIEVARLAYDAAVNGYAGNFDITLQPVKAPQRMVLTGNEAAAIGAIKAGMKFYSSYPMTPSSSILSYLAARERQCGLVVKHAEDEISAAGMAVGAAHTGTRAATGTSGGGFSLMCEFVGAIGITETPMVIIESQRPGPATGLPTRTEQCDLKFVLSASQGEFRRIVIAPSNIEECFRLTFEAFNLADKYQTLIIVLLDKHVSESTWSHEPFETSGLKIDRGEMLNAADLAKMNEYKRYAYTKSGISPRVKPGTPGGVFKATTNEHDEFGRISEDAQVRSDMVDKRMRKLDSLDVSECGWKLHGKPDAEVTIVSWGSTINAVRGAMELLAKKGKSLNLLQVIYMSPFPTDQVTQVLNKAKRTLLVENNATGQLGDVIAENTGIKIGEKLLKYNGRQWIVDELAERLEEIL